MAATASGDVAATVTTDSLDLNFNIDDFDVRDLDFFDFGDLAADEFCDAYSAFVANADAKRVGGGGGGTGTGGGWLAGLSLSGGDGGDGSPEGSPDSVVTDDGPLVGEEAMSAVVAELERYLMEDGDVEGVFCADGDRVLEHICVDDFFGDMLGSDFNGIVTAVSGALHNGGEDNDDGDVLAALEDEPASRKRARYEQKIRGTTITPWWGEPEVTRRHLARFQVPAPWPPAAAVLLCCM
ncbi:hypothetical protein SEVIR_3G030250v4 [Setaria viridis]